MYRLHIFSYTLISLSAGWERKPSRRFKIHVLAVNSVKVSSRFSCVCKSSTYMTSPTEDLHTLVLHVGVNASRPNQSQNLESTDLLMG